MAALTLLWHPLPGEPIWQGPIWIGVVSILAIAASGLCCWRFDQFTFLGVTQAWTGVASPPGKLCIDGPYRYVRHPLMLGLLIALWAQPIMPPELLMMNVAWTLYIVMAIRCEERSLQSEFGADYENYRSQVPMLIPWKIPRFPV